MKSVEGIHEMQVLPRPTASPRPGRDTHWRQETHVRSRVEHISRVGMAPRTWCECRGPVWENYPRMPDLIFGRGKRGPFQRAGTPYPPGWYGRDWAEADHGERGKARERVSVPSAFCRDILDQFRARGSAGSPPREQRSPRKGPWPRRVDPSTTTRGRQGGTHTEDRGCAAASQSGCVVALVETIVTVPSKNTGVRWNSECLDLV